MKDAEKLMGDVVRQREDEGKEEHAAKKEGVETENERVKEVEGKETEERQL